MSDPNALNGAPVGGELGSWSEKDVDRFELARRLLNAVIAAYSTRIAAAPDASAGPRTEQARYATELRNLDPTDEVNLTRIVREYPVLIRRVRGEPGA